MGKINVYGIVHDPDWTPPEPPSATVIAAMMRRLPGFYWVKDTDNEWMVARWLKDGEEGCWQVTGSEEDYIDTDFLEIGEQV